MHGWNSCARLIGKSKEKLSPSKQRTIFVESSPISEHSLRPDKGYEVYVVYKVYKVYEVYEVYEV